MNNNQTAKFRCALSAKADEAICEYNMITQGDTVAVCLSGGADSMALFHFLCTNKQKYDIKIIALHINHGLRKESDDEQIIVENFCKSFNVKCFVLNADMNNRQKPKGFSTEMWARKTRYEYFDEMAQKYNASIATAHTLSDKCETILFNITRGSGLKGACGIPAKRENIIRPLIGCTRCEIETYCKQNEIPYVTDNTNFEDIYSRNKIRLKVMPVLTQINSKAEKSIGDFSKENEEIYTYLTQLSDNLYKNSVSSSGFSISEIKKHDDVIIKIFLRKILDNYGCLSKENLSAIFTGVCKKEFSQQLSKDIICKISNGFLTFYKPDKKLKDLKCEKVDITFDKMTTFLSGNYVISKISAEEFEKIKKDDKNYFKYCLDCDTIGNALVFRNRKEKDVFTLQKRNVSKSLKKLFIEDKILPSERQNIAVLSNEKDEVLWLEGYGTSKQFSVTTHTKNIVIIRKE